MFRIKICGVTRVEDARLIAAAGADAIGLNFYAGSPRCVAVATARAIAAALPPEVAKVGVFVNAAVETIRATVEQVGLDIVQLHGDEPPELIAELAPLPVVRAWRAQADRWDALREYLDACRRSGALPAALLVDAHQSGAYGGTGSQVDWAELAARGALFAGLPLILAGGLRPDNVAAAIRAVQPWGIDTASGVEASPGAKDPALVQEFVTNARQAMGL